MICTDSLLLSKAAGIFQCTDADAFALKFARVSEGQLNVGGVASARNIIIWTQCKNDCWINILLFKLKFSRISDLR